MIIIRAHYNIDRQSWIGKNDEPLYFKAVDKNMRGGHNFQYEIGKDFEVEDFEDLDNWKYCHFAKTFTSCINNSKDENIVKFLLVKPLTKLISREAFNEFDRYYVAKQIRVIDEIHPVSVERCLITEMIKYKNPRPIQRYMQSLEKYVFRGGLQ